MVYAIAARFEDDIFFFLSNVFVMCCCFRLKEKTCQVIYRSDFYAGIRDLEEERMEQSAIT